MKASLPMYDRTELSGVHDRLWALLRHQLIGAGLEAPLSLAPEGVGDAFWTADDLVLSQTCGFPYRTRLYDKVGLVGTPDWDLLNCPPGYYYSAVVVRRSDVRKAIDDYADATFAINSLDSQSGYVAMRNHMAESGFWFARELISGSHVESARLVASGKADIAALDIVSWHLMRRHDLFPAQLQVLLNTEPTPALPYITAKRFDRDIIFKALEVAISQLPVEDKDMLGIKGVVQINASEYMKVAIPADLRSHADAG